MADTGGKTAPAADGKPEPGLADDLAALQRALQAIAAEGGRLFNPARFQFLEALVARVRKQAPAVARLLAARAWTCLRDYEAELTRARPEAAAQVRQLVAQDPAAAATAEHLLAVGDFNAISRQATRLRLRQQQGRCHALTEKLRLEPATALSDSNAAMATAIRHQERLILASINESGGNAGADSPRIHGNGQLPELKSAQALWDSLARRHADRLVSDALSENTADTGPLNPQLLVIRSLAALRELSPAYLNRFVSLVDTLLWLEAQAGGPGAETDGKRKRKQKP
jgi:hypothetical protein